MYKDVFPLLNVFFDWCHQTFSVPSTVCTLKLWQENILCWWTFIKFPKIRANIRESNIYRDNFQLMKKIFCTPEKDIHTWVMDKFQLTGQNLGRVIYFRYGRMRAVHFLCLRVNLPNLKLKTRPKEVLGSLLFDIVLPAWVQLLFYAECRCHRAELV